MKLAVLIPTRGDRPKFLANCKRMLASQTLQPDEILFVDYPPKSNAVDITERYRTGYDMLRNKGFDLIALMEDDDWYHPEYLKYMVNIWIEKERPKILGTSYTIYYHINERGWFTMYHSDRSSAMNTFIIPDLEINWCSDSDPFTDMFLWGLHPLKPCRLDGIIITPHKTISMGIKHGVGLCGGRSHVDKLQRYRDKDPDGEFLKQIMDEESFKFYWNYFK